jgi:hypothetical protein
MNRDPKNPERIKLEPGLKVEPAVMKAITEEFHFAILKWAMGMDMPSPIPVTVLGVEYEVHGGFYVKRREKDETIH